MKAHSVSFPFCKGLEEDILTTTYQAPYYVDVRWYNGYLGDSLVIADPHGNKEKGWIRIEMTTPFSQPHDRPSIRIEESEYPDLFRRIVKNYEEAFSKGDTPPDKYRQQPKPNLQVIDARDCQTE